MAIVVDSITMDISEGALLDLDFHVDESCIIVGFRGDVTALVNMKTKTVKEFSHRLPHPLTMVQFLRHLPGEGHFFLLSKGGVYRAWNLNMKYMEVARFHES